MAGMSVDRPAAEPQPAMRLALAGVPLLHRPGVPPLPLGPRDAAMLAWLALEGPTPRTRLATLLWPESDMESARNALRQRLFKLKKQFGSELVAGASTLSLADGVVHDLGDSDGVLGENGDTGVGGELGAWLSQQRERRRGRLRSSLLELAGLAERARDYPDALSHARELLALDPLSEDAHRRVIRLLYLAGDRAAALLAFDACERMLKHEVGTRPGEQTLELLRQVESSAPALNALAVRTVPASVLRPPRLVGRDAEWNALLAAWDASAVMRLSGEAGMGKTRLLADLAQRHGDAAVKVSARPGDAGVPYALMARLLRAWLARGAAPPAERHQRELARLLPELGEAPKDHEGRELALHEALVAALAAAAAHGVAGMLVDDLHFADAASLETLQQLCGVEPAVAWVLAFRGAELSAAGQVLVHETLQDARQLALAPLTLDAVAALVDSLGVASLAGAALAAPLLRHTGGNPLYLLETLKALHLQGPAAAADGGDLALPSARDVVQLIGRRLARLSPAALKLARCAAVAGQDFSTVLATEVLAAGPLDLADAWAELEDAQVLREAAFAHDLIHDAALATVPPALARRLHALIAQALAARGAPAQRLAAHWVASDTPDEAVPCLLEAGRRAVQALRPEEARAAYVQAADLLQARGREHEALQALLAFLDSVFLPASDASLALLDRGDRLASSPSERALLADRRGDILARSGDFIGAGAAAQQALAALDADEHPALAARLLCHAAAADLAQGLHDRAVERMHRSNDLASRSGDLAVECTAASILGSVLDHAHRYAEAYHAHRRAYELMLRRGESPIAVISVAANMAGNRTHLGLFDAALEKVQACYRLGGEQAIDVDAQWPSLRVHHGYTLLGLADYTQALRVLEDAHAAIAQQMPGWLPAVDNMMAVLWIHLGQWARARRAVEAALAGAASLPRYRARALRLQSEICAALNEARDAALQEEIDATGAGAGPLVGHQDGLARALALAPAEGYALASRLRDEAQARQMPNQVLEAETRCARLALQSGLPERAAMHAREALQRLREVTPTNFYRGEVWLAAAEALAPTAPAEREQLLRSAAEWIHETARLRVPAEFQHGFLHRNPVNHALLAQAARAG
jgi:DNA-binding SARP family transcriptional activator